MVCGVSVCGVRCVWCDVMCVRCEVVVVQYSSPSCALCPYIGPQVLVHCQNQLYIILP